MILIDEGYQREIDPLTPEEYNALEESILEYGCRDAIVLWGDTIVDGHNRYEICTSHDVPFRTMHMDFDSRDHALLWINNNQDARRNQTQAQRIDRHLRKKEILERIGRARQSDANVGMQRAAKDKMLLSNMDKSILREESEGEEVEPHNTQKQIAESAGVSTGTLARAEVARRDAPEVWQLAKSDKASVNEAYKAAKLEPEDQAEVVRQVQSGESKTVSDAISSIKKESRAALIQQQREAIEKGAVALPEGVFEVVAMDPPWNYGREYDPDGSRVANPYPEMTQAQLLEMEPPFADDCVLFLWTTHQFLFDAKELLDHWGFTYKATLVWDKERMGMGAWFRMQCEFCLVGVKGKPTWDNTTHRDIIREARREHSRKPDAFYKMVQEVTVGRRLEYFSREQREGWEVFGNDTQKF